jgi:hypothetical protein
MPGALAFDVSAVTRRPAVEWPSTSGHDRAASGLPHSDFPSAQPHGATRPQGTAGDGPTASVVGPWGDTRQDMCTPISYD